MATITLTAVPARYEQHATRSYTTKVTELLGTCLGRSDSEAKSLDEIRTLVTCFGQGVAAQHPGQSFTVLVGTAKGSRKPNGSDTARFNTGLGQEGWMTTVVMDDRLIPFLGA